MHLFSHRWGGQPTDSNLVPAHGGAVNIPFNSGLEEQMDKAIKGGKTVWYESKAELGHTVPIPPAYRPSFNLSATQDYLSSFEARWGTYAFDAGAGKFTENEEGRYEKSPGAPKFPTPGATTLPNIHDMGEGPLTSLLGPPFKLWEVRKLKAGINKLTANNNRATSATDLSTKLAALSPPYNMSTDMLDRLKQLENTKLTF